MQNILEEIRNLIEGPMHDIGLEVDSIDYVLENNYHFLKIVLDRVNGIDLDTIVEATNIINPIMDENDLIKEEYILDISSKERG